MACGSRGLNSIMAEKTWHVGGWNSMRANQIFIHTGSLEKKQKVGQDYKPSKPITGLQWHTYFVKTLILKGSITSSICVTTVYVGGSTWSNTGTYGGHFSFKPSLRWSRNDANVAMVSSFPSTLQLAVSDKANLAGPWCWSFLSELSFLLSFNAISLYFNYPNTNILFVLFWVSR